MLLKKKRARSPYKEPGLFSYYGIKAIQPACRNIVPERFKELVDSSILIATLVGMRTVSVREFSTMSSRGGLSSFYLRHHLPGRVSPGCRP